MRVVCFAAPGLAACIVSVPLSVQTQAKTQVEKYPKCVLTATDPPAGFIGEILYAGQLDGLVGSKNPCSDKDDLAECNDKIKEQGEKLYNFRQACRGILVGTGDDLGPPSFEKTDLGTPSLGKSSHPPATYDPDEMINERKTPDFKKNAMVDVVAKTFNALVPGKEEFAWGAEYLRRLGYVDPSTSNSPLPLIAINLTVQPKPDPECLSFPSPNTALPLLPNQVSSPIASPGTSGTGMGGGGNTGGPGGGGGSGGGGGKGKGKGKGGGGGGVGGGAGGAGGGGAAGGCPGSPTAGIIGGAQGAGQSSAAPVAILTIRQQKAFNNPLRPQLVSPNAQSFYPWTTSIAVSVPDGAFNDKSDALLCPADPDPDKVDEIKDENKCIHWGPAEVQAVFPNTQADEEAQIQNQSGKAGPGTATKIFRPQTRDKIPVLNEGVILHSKIIDREDKTNKNEIDGELYPGNSVKVCLELNDGGKERPKKADPEGKHVLCTFTPIDVQRVLFDRAWIIPTPTEAEHAYSTPYVVFAAVASDALNGVSDTNKDWAPAVVDTGERPAPTMQVSIGDQNAALSQALATFNMLQLATFNQLPLKDEYTAVVLAQMTPAEARSLADSLAGTTKAREAKTTAKLIISAADEAENSPEITIKLHLSNKIGKQEPKIFIPVLTPAPSFQTLDCMTDSSTGQCVAHAVLTRDSGLLTMQNVPADIQDTPDTPTSSPQQRTEAPSAFCDNQLVQTWECKVLKDMIQSMYDILPKSHPDIALLETKDFDYRRSGIQPDSVATATMPSPTQELEALWNAGNVTRVTLLGSTLMTILNQVSSNQTQTFQTIASTNQSQQLRILGVSKVGQSYYVNGIPLDANMLYAVVTSDNMATTSSDYSSLASIDLNAPEVFWHQDATQSIAQVATEAKHKKPRKRSELEAQYWIPPTLTNRRESAPQLSPIALSLTHSTRTVLSTTDNSVLSDIGKEVELRPIWRVAIQQLSMGFSNSRPSQSDQDIGANLGGVSNPNVVSPHNDVLSSVFDSRVMLYLGRKKREFYLADLGVDGQINFTRSIQGSTTPPTGTTITTENKVVPVTSISYPANTYVASPFLESQAVRMWKPLVFRPGAVTANVASLTNYLPSKKLLNQAPNSSTIDFVLSQKRTMTWGQGVGTRFEGSDFTYVEFGGTYQRSYNVLSAVSVPGQTPCPLNSSNSLSTCASSLIATVGKPLQASYATYNQKGAYLLGTVTQEFPRNPFKKGYPIHPFRKAVFLYQGTAFGNFFAYGPASTSSALTRYAFALNNTLLVQLPSNFSFGPSYNWFFFQANEHGPHSSLRRSSINAQFNYSFDWHTGLSLAHTMAGKTQ